jgi:PAS domain S-box-containing protein
LSTSAHTADRSSRRLSIPGDLSRVAVVRAWLEEIAASTSLSPARTFDMQVVVSEAVANAVEHAASAVDIEVWVLPDRLVVEVTNDGPFRPGLYRDGEGRRRGLGLPLMVSLADQVHVSRMTDQRTKVTLTFFTGLTPELETAPESVAAAPPGSAAKTDAWGGRFKRASPWFLLAPVPLLIVLAAVFYGANVGGVRESAGLLTAFNTLFTTAASFVIAYLAARTYLAGGSGAYVMLGAGGVALGVGSLLAGPFISEPNTAITVHNTLFLVSGVLFVASGLSLLRRLKPEERSLHRLYLGLTYLGVVVLATLLSLLSGLGDFPAYYVPGVGFTQVRAVVLGFGVVTFIAAAVCYGLVCRKRPSRFALMLGASFAVYGVALGAGLLTAAATGSPINWLVRAGTWIGGVYLLLGVLSLEQGGAWLLPLERSLRESEDRYRQLVDLSPEAVFIHSDGRFRFANPAAAALLGFSSPRELIGREVDEALAPATRNAGRQRIAAVYAGGVAHPADEVFLRADGSLVEVNVVRTRIEYEGRLAVQTSARDTTERKQAAEALRESEERFRGIFTSNVAALAIWDTEGHLLDANDRFLEMIGYTRHDFEAGDVRWDEATPAEMRQRDYHVVRELQAGKEIKPYEKEFLRPDGTRVPVIVGGGMLPGSPNVGVAFAIDITERKYAQEALVESRAAYQSLAENLPGVLMRYDRALRVVYLSPQAEQITGVPTQDFIGHTNREVGMPEDLSDLWEDAIRAVFESGRGQTVEFSFSSETGDSTFLLKLVPELDADGHTIAHVLGISTDITQRVQAERTLRESEARQRVLAEENERLYREQALIATGLQSALLDITRPVAGIDFAHLYRSASRDAAVGGDFYDVFEVNEGRIAVLIGDVSGHGVEAARVATLVKDVVHAFAHQFRRPSVILGKTNGLLLKKRVTGFVTLFLGILDRESGLLAYSSAGHPNGMLRKAKDRVELLDAGSLPLGIFEGDSWRESRVQVQKEDLLLLYTDGAFESRRDGELFGQHRLVKTLEEWPADSPERLPEKLLAEVLRFCGGELKDDVAIVALRLVEYR